MSGVLGDLVRWTVEVVHSFGYAGVAVLIAATSVPLPVPSEVVLPLAGFLVLLAATAGSVVGSLIPYTLGRRLGEQRVRRFVGRFGRFALVSESDLEKAGGWFERHGEEGILLGRLVPGAGTLVSVPAGLKQMPVWRFAAYTAVGSATWNAAFIVLGWVLGRQWRLVQPYAHVLEYAVLVAVGGVVLWLLWRRRRAPRR
jgi:membrane protein DedA with SNARE-associated domain